MVVVVALPGFLMKGAMDLNKETEGAHQVEVLSGELSVVVPENLVAFEDLKGRAVVARTVDLETLVDLDKLLSIAEVWGPWFSQLVAWNGQPFPFERVAWLRLHGIPMHLLNPEVVRLIGGPFGKVLHVPKGIEDDKDLSIHRVAILTGETKRITEVMALKWCDKTFRVLVEEELDVWVPDCLGGSNSSPSCSSPLQSSPVVGDWVPEVEVEEGSQRNSEPLGEGVEKGSGLEGGMAAGVNAKFFDCSLFEEGSVSKGVNEKVGDVSDKGVFLFKAKKKYKRRRKGGPSGQPAESGFCSNSILDSSGKDRPNKRSRAQAEEDSDPFSIMKLLARGDEREPKEVFVQTEDSYMPRDHSTPIGGNGLDLNLRAASSGDSRSGEVHREGEEVSNNSTPVDSEVAATLRLGVQLG
ncbi:hypothetical protein HanRHA438_Chr14g0661901 [Helianthus annuus]|uniref:DUF4283 domain-containing protein n=1 Tax=Helianthus annuus TaxID=4232 RepID=A0A9K3H795_HELAN|nr:hypothetical protein HanXRQr2_Chr14g0651181 [Helianthus annuus]KAJ0464663.1 hypothetical protein HanHA300_Chr14g0529851 [Helianthus annuus]KAJ0486260.1 hypothetical protein HanHA89_Chr14g0577721 [Helianthus annuus]KAJ0656812.1 hypothetical protein HanLR1_Chr14g0540141 [Helianthus annuus]KAJ0660408.1 hypothetical protein HanOQP8_Chr14g0537461 [Helianthus annuus]